MSELLPLIRATNTKRAASRIRARGKDVSSVMTMAERIVRTTRKGGDKALLRY